MAANADNKGRQTWVEQIGEQEYQCAATARGILFAINAIYIAFVRSLHGRQIAYKYQSVSCMPACYNASRRRTNSSLRLCTTSSAPNSINKASLTHTS